MSELVCRPNAGLVGEDENDDRTAAPFLIEVDGGTANGEKLKADAVDRIAAAPSSLILYFVFAKKVVSSLLPVALRMSSYCSAQYNSRLIEQMVCVGRR